MKLVTFEVQGCERIGVVEGDRVIDLGQDIAFRRP